MDGKTGEESYEIASEEAPDISTVSTLIRRLASEELDRDVPIELIENARDAETLVERFDIATAGL